MKSFQRIVGVVAVLCLVLGVVRLWFTPSALAVTTTPPEIVITETDPASPNPVGVNDTFEGTLDVNPTNPKDREEGFPGDTEITWKVLSVTKDGTPDNSLISQINCGTGDQTSIYSGSFTNGGVYEIQFQATASSDDWSDKAVSPPFTVTVLVGSVVIGDFYRVAPTKTQQIAITSTLAKLPAGYSFSVVCETDSDTTGDATVSPGTISGTGTVTVTGGTQSWGGSKAAPGNIKLRVKLGNVVCAEKAFTVCAHPVNFSTQQDTDPDIDTDLFKGISLIGLAVHNFWESDSGKTGDTLPDLDKAWVMEDVKQGPKGEAFTGTNITVQTKYLPAVNAQSSDSHALDRRGITDGPAGKSIVYQTFTYKCDRCEDADKICSHSGFEITHELLNDNGVWKLKTSKNGKKVTTGAGTSEAGDGKAESSAIPIHKP